MDLKCHKYLYTEGFTLMEITVAMAIFCVAAGIAAQGMLSYYVVMDMQHQRVVATNHNRGILSTMRNLRDANPNTPTLPNNFQTAVLAAFPHNQEMDGPASLRNAKVRVTYEDAAVAANPLVATVTMTWNDLRNRPMTLRLTSAITD